MSWEWTPLIGVGPVVFESSSETLQQIPGMRLEELKRFGEQTWSYYWSDSDGVSVTCCDMRIGSIGCHLHFLYRGVNLVGMLESEARLLLRDQPVTIGEFPDGHTLEFSDVGLELTIREGKVLIASAFGEKLVPI